MEDHKSLMRINYSHALRVFISFSFLGFLLASNFSYSYSPLYTHPDLTEEIANLWNLKNGNQNLEISQKEIEWMKKGATDEDEPARWINHFYDPVHKTGWSGKHFGYLTEEKGLYQGESMSPMTAIASINWVINQEYQSAYGRQYGNQTWQKAIDAYVKGDEKTAFIALGHILHLVEDLSVPDHTRDDTHADLFGDPGSPYEKYSQEYTNSNQGRLNIAENLENKDFINLLNIQDTFDYLANYSNNNFFSEDTISNEEFDLPNIDELEDKIENIGNKKFLFLYNKQRQIYLAILKEDGKYSLDNNIFILPSYFSNLAPKAVLTGASVLKLFFEETEKYKENPELLPEIIPDSNEAISLYLQKSPRLLAVNSKDVYDKAIIDANINLAKSKKIIKSAYNKTVDTIKTTSNTIKIKTVSAYNKTVDTSKEVLGNIKTGTADAYNNSVSGIKNLFSYTSIAQTSSVINSVDVSLGFKGGTPVVVDVVPASMSAILPESVSASVLPNSIGNISIDNLTSLQNQLNQAQVMVNALQNQASYLNNNPTSKVVAVIPASQNIAKNQNSIVQPTSIPAPGFGGGGPPQASSGYQSGAVPDNSSSQSQTEETLIVELDTEAPDIALSILECENSLALTGCLTKSHELNISWSSSASDLDYFTISENGAFSTTTATSTVVALSENSIFSFGVSARDKAGNISATSTKTVSTFNSPVVINEVAWAGTEGNSSDEWIELYNNADYDIALSNWFFEAGDGAPYIPLSGLIKAKDYYLIERSDDNTISDITADLIAPFSGAGNGSGLSNGGEVLMLSYKEEGRATTTIDKVAVSNNGGRWIGGSTYEYQTMERIDSIVSGEDALNWGTNNRVIISGKGVSGSRLMGTPKRRNSISSLIAGGASYITGDIVLTKSESPYFVNNQWQNFQDGASLTIEPGVVIKFYNTSGLMFRNASIIADGTPEEPIVFTSLYDDEYGGDTNYDATSTIPFAGTWYGVDIDGDDSGGSVFDNTIFRYGGVYYNWYYAPRANLRIDHTSPPVTNSIFEESLLSGLIVANSNSLISDNIFRNNNKGNDTSGTNSGVVIGGGSTVFKNNIVENNDRGLNIGDISGVVDSNIFDSNKSEAVYASGRLPRFTNNSASRNKINGTVIRGGISIVGATTTLAGDTMPYVMDRADVNVLENSTVVIEKGAVFKSSGAGLKVNGNLVINGEKSDDIIFTSLYDDTIFPGTIVEGTTTPVNYPLWKGIHILKDGSMEARGFTVRYAGDNYRGDGESGVSLEESSAHISDALFTNNYPFGLLAKQSNNLVIENSVFRDNNYDGRWGTQGAMAIYNSSTTLTNLLFENNAIGILADTFSTFTTSLIEFINNVIDISPEGLF